ncbi:MAG: RagB/SusD family nutrient uptake outer membrane protein [Cytophagales bacterium]|nr:RagB/SusD family nutrient uptake outer membrane protein [Cytophagales bacterium]
MNYLKLATLGRMLGLALMCRTIKPIISHTNTRYTLTKQFTEHAMVLRLAEQYLVRAEARVQQEKLTDAIDDLDMIRNRAGLSQIKDTSPSINKNEILLAIEQVPKKKLNCYPNGDTVAPI